MSHTTAPTFTGTQTFQVSGMTCSHCERAVTEELTQIDGIASVRVDLPTGAVTVEATSPVSRDQIAGAVEEAGYQLV